MLFHWSHIQILFRKTNSFIPPPPLPLLYFFRVTTNITENKRIWIDGGTHAREWISPATVTFIMNRLMSKWTTQPDYIKNITWYFMPMVNPDGYVYSRRKDRLWRKNRSYTKNPRCRGVDINRNFNVGWNTVGASRNPCHYTYQGPRPHSENETRAIAKFLKSIQPKLEALLTYHSYGQAFVYPYAYRPLKSKHYKTLERVGHQAADIIRNTTGQEYKVGVTYKTLPPSGGGTDDWAAGKLDTKYVYTVELRDRGRFGFVLPPRQIAATALEGYTLALEVAKDIVK
ncbi:carboxypeptidase B-like [Musca domestica]|uniref:Carboxypeptidase B-like n=1 Tax=Musca domestica TaxID=7370 RepID=A0ABM3UWP3_MUSDO|nr:carboxypeptidase B-like [Musca domestica]